MSTDHQIRTHLASVVGARQLTPGVRRITFGGEDIERYESLAPDQFLYLLLPPPGRRELTVDRDFDWISYHLMDEADRPVGAHYTVRHHRPAAGEIDVDFVLHPDPGPASGWAVEAAPGDPVALWGPRTTFRPPPEVDWFLLVADETGLPATAAILESLEDTFPGQVRAIVEVADRAEEQPLPSGPSIEVTWLHRGDRPAGTTGRLVEAVHDLKLPDGEPYVWGGGESRTMTHIRRHLRHEVGFPRERVSLTPYWRHPDHAGDPDDEEE